MRIGCGSPLRAVRSSMSVVPGTAAMLNDAGDGNVTWWGRNRAGRFASIAAVGVRGPVDDAEIG